MNYQETIEYLFSSAPLFQHIGKDAYKEGLENTYVLDKHFGHPHQQYKTIHVAGTNGKGSCAHSLAAILQASDYKVGLYTSPHLVDFRERIRINGNMIPEEYVVDFVKKEKAFFESLHPSFFELTTALAFKYFAEQNIDVAVIEVGLGGRLDCTNIIHPDLCVITNISFDHVQFLGNTLQAIALEKAGIVKKDVPVVIGETVEETRPVFVEKAKSVKAPIIFAEEKRRVVNSTICLKGGRDYYTTTYGSIYGELEGEYQEKNTNTVLTAVEELIRLGYHIPEEALRKGFAFVSELTGLKGRWQKISTNPIIICDTGHNMAGIKLVVEQLKHCIYNKLHLIIGMVNDKDIDGVLSILPADATYYFTKSSVKRSLNEMEILEKARKFGLKGCTYISVPEAYEAAIKKAATDDLIYIGGSSFIVADLLQYLK